MIYIAGSIIVFTGIQLLIAAANLIFRQLLPKNPEHSNPLVSVLIPARNEEKNIGNIISDLKKQNYQNIEILIFDDQSTDRTAIIVSEFLVKDSRIQLFNSTYLPNGWLGKNFSCYSLSKHARGDYFLFLDADVRINRNIISQTLSYSQKHNLGLLSIFPMQTMKSWGEYITIPNMNYILLSLLPLILVRKIKFPSLSAANGQFMLFCAETYKRINPHERVKIEKVEDIKIAQLLKRDSIKVACLSGTENISCRMYKNYKEAVNGFSKNVITFFGGSPFLAILFWMITTFGFLFVLFVFPKAIVIIYFVSIILIRIFVSVASKQNSFTNTILIIPQQITLGVFIGKAIIKNIKKQFKWKDRNISS
ncbi:glycosyltransferase [Maribellus maritimus]|uniref:glycosyltransferase n=1 Tax=Maribellus maritimus TaxID=2870838 RepID=UPI001EEB0EBD|nr:glycosyltransferase family A protein [Maribellus maritimus]MCG6189191.1 glycosyltransferase family 2 protein [Maribellus maritimus]